MFVSATRLRLRSALSLLPFFWRSLQAQKQAARSPGFLGGRLLTDRNRAFWTITAWESEQAMREYRGTGAHARAMPRLIDWCDEASIVHWSTDSSELPSWTEAADRMRRDGRPTRLTHPSPDHEARRIPEPVVRQRFGQELRPMSHIRTPDPSRERRFRSGSGI